jgi:hypothetical protein
MWKRWIAGRILRPDFRLIQRLHRSAGDKLDLAPAD